MPDTGRKPLLESVEVIVSLGQNQRRTPAAHRFDDVVADATRARLVADQFFLENLELDSFVRIGTSL